MIVTVQSKWIKTGFLNRNKIYLTCFLLLITFLTGSAQLKQFGEITFEFNEVTHQMFLKEYEHLKSSQAVLDKNTIWFAALLPTIDPLFAQKIIPEDFRFLALYDHYQTNFLNIDKNEGGVFWNLTYKDAELQGLKISDQVNEMKYWPTATEAFIKKTTALHTLYSNQAIVLYNLLADPVIINQLDIENNWNQPHIFLDNPNYRAIIKFLAYKEFIENQFTAVATRTPQVYYEFKSGEGENLSSLADLLQLDIMKLVTENQWLLSGKIPTGYFVSLLVTLERYYDLKKIDASRILDEDFELNFPVIALNESLSKGKGGIFYTINSLPGIQAEMGDKFINLAYKAGISPKKFLKYNDIGPLDNIIPGEIYYLKPKRKKAAIPFHIVKPSETLWQISQKYGVRLENLMAYNRIEKVTKPGLGLLLWLQEKRSSKIPVEYIPIVSPNISELPDLEVKQVIPSSPPIAINSTYKEAEETVFILKSTSRPAQTQTRVFFEKKEAGPVETKEDNRLKPKFLVHSVKKGETLNAISEAYGVSIANLKEINNLFSSEVEVGDKIIIRKN